MPKNILINERYKDWYCEDILEGYLNGEIDLDELILKLDYDKVQEQIELFNALNLILSNKYLKSWFNGSLIFSPKTIIRPFPNSEKYTF